MTLATRYGLTGIGALALLSLVHWYRGSGLLPLPGGNYLLGVLPNFAAAIAITFVLLSIWSDQHRGADYESTKRVFLVAASISGIGLTAWEFLQETSKRLIFDAHDLGATLVGIVAAGILFYVLTRGLRLEP